MRRAFDVMLRVSHEDRHPLDRRETLRVSLDGEDPAVVAARAATQCLEQVEPGAEIRVVSVRPT